MVRVQQLNNALQDVFSASMQPGDELNFPSATLLLAGLLQVHSRTPRFASHSARLASFPESSTICTQTELNVQQRKERLFPSSEELASAGFYHTGCGDETVCPACGLGLRDWQSSDQPEDCHLAFSTAKVQMLSSSIEFSNSPIPALPCLYLASRRYLISELPLTRKFLLPFGSNKSICAMPGISTPPSSVHSDAKPHIESTRFASLADRLRSVARIMAAPPSPQGWPIENARALGHSDDLIVLALWRMQAESSAFSLVCPPLSALHLDPQATTDLLRTILRLQELFDEASKSLSDFDYDALFVSDLDEKSSDVELTAEDAETAALSECVYQRTRSTTKVDACSTQSPPSLDSNITSITRIRLPRFYQLIMWWDSRWPVVESSAQ